MFVAGSTQHPEEEYALDVFQTLSSTYPNLRLVLVPRHPERGDEVAQLLNARGVSWARRTRISLEEPLQDQRILLVDTVGELGGWWGCADIGFVGGSMGNRGGQNMLEPSGYGVATCFGPNTENFRDIVEQLLSAEAVVEVRDDHELLEFVKMCLSDEGRRLELGRRARNIVLSQRGATDATLALLRKLLANPRSEAVIGRDSLRRSA